MRHRTWTMKVGARAIALAGLATLITSGGSLASDSWTSRSGDLQNTGNAGQQPGLTPENVKDLSVTRIWQPETAEGVKDGANVNHTPIVTNGLLIYGDWMGRLYVIDLERGSTDPQDDILLRVDTASRGNLDGRERWGDYVAQNVFRPADVTDPANDATGGAVHGVIDEFTGLGHLGEEFGNYMGIQGTPTVGMVTVPDGAGGEKDELRLYVPAIAQSRDAGGLYCFNLTKVLEDKDAVGLTRHDGFGYACDGGDWPRTLIPEGSSQTVYNGSPKLSVDQPWDFDGDGEVDGVRDVLYTPSTGLDCADGRMWAMDPVTGELLWDFDPVQNHVYGGSLGGVIWTTPAISADRSIVYVTTGNCVTQPQVGEMAESLVALDARTGDVVWHHQRRLIDTADLDIGVGPSVVDDDSFPGCHVVVSGDKDGCIYGYEQQPDIPEVGDTAFDPLRPGQQRVLWRKCFVPGTLNGGFNSSNGAVHDNLFIQQTNVYPGGHNGADDSNAFALDACTGKLKWASSDIGGGRTDAAIASDMLFQLSPYRILPGSKVGYRFFRELQVTGADSGIHRVPEVLATVVLPSQPSLGGGGAAIANDRVYVPIVGGVAEIAVVPDSGESPPRKYGLNVFAGPYPYPVIPGAGIALQPVNPDDPYPLMLENPNPSAIVESIQGFVAQQQRDATTLQQTVE